MEKIKKAPLKNSTLSIRKSSSESYIEATSRKDFVAINPSPGKNVLTYKKDFATGLELTRQLQNFARNEDASIFAIVLGALHVIFYRYNIYDDICVGIPSAFKYQAEEEKPIILFNNLVPLQNKISAENSFRDLLKDINHTVIKASEDNNPLNKTEEETILSHKDLNLQAPSQVMLVVENEERDSELQFGLLQLSAEPFILNLSKPELHFLIKETKDGLRGTIEYNAELYKEERIDRMVNHLQRLLTSIIKSPNEKVSKLDILRDAEKHQLLAEFNDTATPYPRDKTIVNLFEEQVNKNPDHIAAIFENEKFSFSELNKRSNQLAWYLLKYGVKKETLIPICVERSAEMLIAILGILKAGAAYVPIDPDYPIDRISYMLGDTKARLIISNKASRKSLPVSSEIDVIEIDEHNIELNNMPVQNPDGQIHSRNIAYVIYTSGSTGKPKGVMIEHQAVADHCFGLIKVAQLHTCRSFALFSPLVFDAGHSIIFTSIFLGASLNILSKQLIMDGEKLVLYLEKNPVDCIKIVPSVWLSYINGENIVLADKVMIFGGETFSLKIQEHLLKVNYEGTVYNHYGPTEATIGKCIHKVDLKKAYKRIPIGKPFSNTQLYVVDSLDQLVPIETPGELYIAGEGIAREYLNRPGLTAEKFIANPFANSLETSGPSNIHDTVNPTHVSRLYKTGDKVKWNSDGEIEYLGRIDEQVKISGYRIELGEIENVLLQNKKINEAAVQLCEDNNNNKVLVGYVVPHGLFDKQQTIAQLQEKLPEYMVPGLWVELDYLPLTPNGKIDKKALPVPDFSALLNDQYTAPQNDTEAALVKIWGTLLGIEKIGTHDTFFELGGNSIQAVTMFSRIRKQLGVTLPLATIFQAPDINKLAAIIDKKDTGINLSCLVAIQPQGSNTPLFCMHAGAGNVLFYKDLAKELGTQQPVYGLMARGLLGKEHFHMSIEDMAAHYIKEIQTVQPHGPYQLAGYCLGGTIAFEIAQQLLKVGEQVKLLATFNSRSSAYLNAPSADVTDNNTGKKPLSFSAVVRAYAGNYSSLKSKEKLIYPLKVIKIGAKVTARVFRHKTQKKALRLNAKVTKMAFDYYLSKGWLLPAFLRNKYLLHTNGYMSRAYKTGVYPGKMLVFRSPQLYADPYLGWKDHVSGEIESYDVTGMYKRRSEIMNEPYIKVISGKLKTILG